MCGIFFYKGPARNVGELRQLFMKTKHRGPDSSVFKVFYLDSGEMVAMGFHRLAINGMATTDEQPFHSDHTYVMCNGEIWNHNELRAEEAEANGSDCKCLLPYYRKHGMQAMCDAIDGVFGCVVYDEAANEAKDNVKYLATLERFMEPLYSGDPEAIIDMLPAMMNSLKMIHTIARYFNTTERMTKLFMKITNQMILTCKLAINGKDPPDMMWDRDPEKLLETLESCLRLNECYQIRSPFIEE